MVGFSHLGMLDVIGDHVEVVPSEELLLQWLVVNEAAVWFISKMRRALLCLMPMPKAKLASGDE